MRGGRWEKRRREKRGREEGEGRRGGGRRERGRRKGGKKRKFLRAQSARRSRREEGDEGREGGGKGAGGGWEAYPAPCPPPRKWPWASEELFNWWWKLYSCSLTSHSTIFQLHDGTWVYKRPKEEGWIPKPYINIISGWISCDVVPFAFFAYTFKHVLTFYKFCLQ